MDGSAAEIRDASGRTPWGGPGPGFVSRRRAWLHQLCALRRSEREAATARGEA